MKTADFILNLTKYFSLIHTSKGRLRVRISSKIKDEFKNLKIQNLDIEQEIKKIDGIKSIKLNKLIGSLTIEYDHTKIEEKLWLDLLNGENLENVKLKIDELERRYLEI